MPALTISITGTLDPGQPAVKGKAVGGSGVAFNNCGDTDFDARVGTEDSINLFYETNQIVAGLAAALGIPAFAVMDQLMLNLAAMRRNPDMGERVYQQ